MASNRSACSAGAASRHAPLRKAAHSRSASINSAICPMNQGSMRVSSAIRAAGMPARKARLIWKTRSGVGWRSAAVDGGRVVVLQAVVARRRADHPARPVVLQRPDALLEGFLEGPADGHGLAHDFIWMVSRQSASGNFSHGKRGNFTTT